jgi:RNA polymerase sigma-70 factor (ECF subfamily)
MSEVLISPQELATLDFATFFEREHVRLGRAVYLLTADAAEAEELIQEAMARAFERWDHVSRMSEPAGYVYRIASNLHRHRIRRGRRLIRLMQGGMRQPQQPQEDPAEAAEHVADVWAALATLTRQQRDAVILVEFMGYDAETAGRVLGIESVSVRVRLHRARAKLRERLGGNDD